MSTMLKKAIMIIGRIFFMPISFFRRIMLGNMPNNTAIPIPPIISCTEINMLGHIIVITNGGIKANSTSNI